MIGIEVNFLKIYLPSLFSRKRLSGVFLLHFLHVMSAFFSYQEPSQLSPQWLFFLTMCPPSYHHSGFVATHALGHMMYGYILLVPVNQKSAQQAKQGA